jgi:hypothetical protein
MRNAKDSWNLSDSGYCEISCDTCEFIDGICTSYIIGEKDMKLAQTLIKAGKEHRKFLRQIMISVDITAPRYWWSEFDTYKIGVTANSCSTMHKLADYPITIDMFEVDDLFYIDSIEPTIQHLEILRQQYKNTGDITYFRAMKQRLPESFLQKRTVTMNYEVAYEMVRQRSPHRLYEWSEDTMKWIKSLPYSKEFIFDLVGRDSK